MNDDHLLSAYNYQLPPECIAQVPVVPRDHSRLLVVKDPNQYTHAVFQDLASLLKPGDLLVMNNTRVIPARLYGRKSTGLPVEILLLEPQAQPDSWLALVKPGKRLKVGARIVFGNQDGWSNASGGMGDPGQDEGREPIAAIATADPGVLIATVVAIDPPTGGRVLQFDVPSGESLTAMIEQLGQVPLPPYITASAAEPQQYQTIYAERSGAVAAPTAGLHFTPELLQRLQDRGINQAFITLHVGVGTFRPVEVEEVTTHQMHAEWFEVSESVVAQINQTKAQGGRVIAVGTTVVRSLEGAAQNGILQPFRGKTNLFIYPGYQWHVVDGLITNFHLPKSSLMLLVSALIGRQRLLDLYQVAIHEGYRFYSFGDAMLILPEARVDQKGE